MSESNAWVDQNGWALREIPKDAVESCSHAGRCDDDVEYWQRELGFNIPRSISERYVLSSGGWDKEQIAAMSDDELSGICLWMACGDIKEHGEWFGCCE